MYKTMMCQTVTLAFMVISMGIGALLTNNSQNPTDPPVGNAAQQASPTPSPTASETIPPYTPLASLTPSQTLKPPPTFEPATPTPQASNVPSITPTATLFIGAPIVGLNGAGSPTPSTTPGCEPRADWGLRYTVQFNDALASIAQKYNTSVNELVNGNCIKDANVIQQGQELRVPGESHPQQPAVECVPYELLTPFNGTATIASDGTLSFNWRGPTSPRNLIRIHRPDGTTYERLVELRQTETINLSEFMRQGGTYTWYVYPLDNNYAQIPCKEGGPWTFVKGEAATYTPTVAPQAQNQNQPLVDNSTNQQAQVVAPPVAAFTSDVTSGTAPLTVNFTNQSSGDISGYQWNFGDGGTSGDANPAYTYNTLGTYTVTLTVSGAGGSASFSSTITVS